MAATKDRVGLTHETSLEEQELPVAADTVIYSGTFVSTDTNGDLVPLADTAGQNNRAVYYAHKGGCDNTGGLAGAKKLAVMVRGIALVPPGAITAASRGRLIHATADDTIALTSTNNRPVGTLVNVANGMAAIRVGVAVEPVVAAVNSYGWTSAVAVTSHTVTLGSAVSVIHVEATTADSAGVKHVQESGSPAAGFVTLAEDGNGIPTLTFNATDNVTVASIYTIAKAHA